MSRSENSEGNQSTVSRRRFRCCIVAKSTNARDISGLHVRLGGIRYGCNLKVLKVCTIHNSTSSIAMAPILKSFNSATSEKTDCAANENTDKRGYGSECAKVGCATPMQDLTNMVAGIYLRRCGERHFLEAQQYALIVSRRRKRERYVCHLGNLR